MSNRYENIFLNRNLDEIYMKQGFTKKEKINIWFAEFRNLIMTLSKLFKQQYIKFYDINIYFEFNKNIIDLYIYLKINKNKFIILIFYVDDVRLGRSPLQRSKGENDTTDRGPRG